MFVESNRFLPWSCRRYLVTQYGQVLSSSGEELQKFVIDGHQCVELDWINGREVYRVALLVLLAYGLISLPDHLFNQIEPLYRDGSNSNLSAANLLYRFKCGKLEVEDRPGFYYVPMYTTYAINARGDLINLESSQSKTWSVTKGGGPKNQTGGYHYTRVVTDSGFSRVLFRHRALCMVFKPYDESMPSLVVNHLNGRPGDDCLENLEWVTYKRNNEHAIETGLKRNSSMACFAKNLESGEVTRYSSVSACARALFGFRAESTVLNRIRNKEPIRYTDNLVFKLDDGSDWRDYSGATLRHSGKDELVARNVFTGELFKFNGTVAGERLLGVKSATILKHAKTLEILPVGGYNFRYADDAMNWPIHPEKNLRIYKDHPIHPRDGVIALDTTTGAEEFCTSTSKAGVRFKLSKSGTWDRIRNGTLVNGKFRLILYKLKENIVLA